MQRDSSDSWLRAVWAGAAGRLGRRGALAVVGLLGVLSLIGLLRLFWLQTSLMAPPPENRADTEWTPDMPPSILNVPIVYDLAPVIAELEDAVDRRFGSVEERIQLESNDRVEVAFEAERAPFTARLDGDVARVATTLTYRGRGWYDAPILPEIGASCGMPDDDGPQPRAVVELSARLTLTDDWELVGDARVDRVAPASDEDHDKCRVTPLNIDMTERVIDAARDLLIDRLPRMERAIASIDLRSKFEGWWRILHEPIELADDVWLVIDPISVRRGPTEGEGRTLAATVGLTARPHVVLGPKPIPTVPPLPPLDSTSLGEGLRIHATGLGDYDEISDELNSLLAGSELERDGRMLVVRRLRVRGIGGGQLAVEVAFGGAATGRVYLVGTPQFDVASGRVHVPDLEFDVASANLLVNSYGWLMDQGLTELLRERARWPVEDLSRMAGEQLDRGLNRFLTEDVELRGEVNSVDIVGVYARTDRFIVHAQANATAELVVIEVEAPPPP